MPDFHGEGGATVKYAEQVDRRNRQLEADKHYRATRPRPIPTPVTVPEAKTEAPAKPKHKARPSRRPNDNPTRPKDRLNKSAPNGLILDTVGWLREWRIYGKCATPEGRLQQKQAAAKRRAEMDADYGPRRPRKRRK